MQESILADFTTNCQCRTKTHPSASSRAFLPSSRAGFGHGKSSRNDKVFLRAADQCIEQATWFRREHASSPGGNGKKFP
jgi:hypothetical protein